MTDKDAVLDVNALTDECMTGNFAVGPDLHAALDFDEGANPRVVPDRAAIEIYEVPDDDRFSKVYVRRDLP
jgi:hypothetical protein